MGDRLWLCTTTEVLEWGWQNGEVHHRWTHPWFNDLHHVSPDSDQGFIVANTGLDQVLRLSRDGFVTAEWNLADQPTWDRFDPAVDYRKVATTKPHEVHNNYVFSWDGQLWATRFLPQDAVCLTQQRPAIELRHGGPHDGNVFRDSLYFTTVTGRILHCSAMNTSRPVDYCRRILRPKRLSLDGVEACMLSMITRPGLVFRGCGRATFVVK